MTRGRAVHRVGLLAVAMGSIGTFALSFGEISPNRVVSGTALSVFEALPPQGVALLAAGWVALLLASLVRGDRPMGLARGALAAGIIVAIVALSGMAAEAAVGQVGGFARYSIGGGAWLAAFAAMTIIVAGRREAGVASAASWLVTLAAPVGIVALALTGRLSDLGVAVEYRNVSSEFGLWVAQHFTYATVAMLIASLVGVSLGILAHRVPRAAGPIFTVTNVLQTIPGLAMVGILVVPLGRLAAAYPKLREFGIGGLGWAPVVVALTLYALLAVVRNTYAGLHSVPTATVEAGRGMGMSGPQLVGRIELPLAAPIVFTGVRVASQQTIGNATLGAFVAAGTLGAPIFLGFAQQADDLVLLGSIALVTMALIVDGAMRVAQRLVTPVHLRKKDAT